ncbi:MAG TPA: hypothetical protein VK939_15215, partial [Longimicrobiales bacterium]|nr:hypothetical protein [Longimicrobiales bacterium]
AADTLFERALALRPGHTLLLYSLAAVRAGHGGRAPAAQLLLRDAAQRGLAAHPSDDPAFAALRGDSSFEQIAGVLRANGLARGTADIAFTIDDPAFLAEGIAYDPVTRRFFVGSVHRRMIVSVDSAGTVLPFTPAAPSDGALDERGLGVLGMHVDASRRSLWVATAAVPEAEGLGSGDEGRSEIRRYDLDTGQLQRTYRPAAASKHLFGDLTVDHETGTVYISDALAGAVYTITPAADTLAVVLEPGSMDSPQGIVVATGGRHLFVADYSTGVWRVDVALRERVHLTAPAHLSTIGIDGLARYGDALIAVQNYPRPHRVLLLHLTDDASAIRAARVLLSAHPLFDEPTLGAVVDDAFYLVANSQWSKFAPAGAAPHAANTVVLRLRLEERPRGEPSALRFTRRPPVSALNTSIIQPAAASTRLRHPGRCAARPAATDTPMATSDPASPGLTLIRKTIPRPTASRARTETHRQSDRSRARKAGETAPSSRSTTRRMAAIRSPVSTVPSRPSSTIASSPMTAHQTCPQTVPAMYSPEARIVIIEAG